MRVRSQALCPDKIHDHWLGDDGRTVNLVWRGQLFVWRQLEPKPHTPLGAKRGQVTTFSKASRLRLLKLFATVDWPKVQPALFVTLTYPDEVRDLTNRDFNVHRYVMHRHLENHLGKKISAVWRIEWEPRKTGNYVWQCYPHFHLMIFNVRYIHYSVVNSLWKKTINWPHYVRTETERMRGEKQAGYYVSKYVAKISDSSLVYAAYLNRDITGRHWGVLRPSLLARCKEAEMRVTPQELGELRSLCEGAYPMLKGYRGSFTLLGKVGSRIGYHVFGELP